MNEDQFDALVDDATHAVNNLIPDRYLAGVDDTARSGLLVSINDALTPILRDAIDSGVMDDANSTRVCTVAAMIGELLETHIAKCDEDGDRSGDYSPHIVSEAHDTRANIDSIASFDFGAATHLYLMLDDGTGFRIAVDAVEPN